VIGWGNISLSASILKLQKTYSSLPLPQSWTSQRDKDISTTSGSYLQAFCITQVALDDRDIGIRGKVSGDFGRCADIESQLVARLQGSAREDETANASASKEENVIL